jgi:NRPS condensation-like uncharacterized protein
MPFTLLEEALLHVEEATAPWTFVVEVAAGGAVDPQRLARAVSDACRRHPLARSRLATWRASDHTYRWTVATEPPGDTVTVVDGTDDAMLRSVRTAVERHVFDLTAEPPFRIVLAARPGGDHVLAVMSHVAVDGIAALRFVQSVTRAYRCTDDPPDLVPLADARNLDPLAPIERSWQASAESGGWGAARIANDGTGDASRAVELRTIALRDARIIDERPPGTTVGDVLVAALHLGIDGWNRDRGTDSDVIAVAVPVNLRPAAWSADGVTNLSSYITVTTRPDERADGATAAAATARQTEIAARGPRASGLLGALRLGAGLPLGLKRAALPLLSFGRSWVAPTAVLSNYGRVVDPPRFDGAEPPGLWVTTPSPEPVGAGIGVTTVGDTLHLAARAAPGFIDHYLEVLRGQRR